MAKKILKEKDYIEQVKAGINTMTDIVASTLGARGRTVIIDNYMRPTVVTKDGVTVVKAIELDDPVQNVGSSMIREASLKTLELVGDGTTTVCVLAREIFMEGCKLIAAGLNIMEVKKGIDAAVAEVVSQLKAMAISVDDKMLLHVATVSANNDIEIGKLVSDTYAKIGIDGIIKIEDGNSVTTEVKIMDGMQIKQGWLDPFYINNEAKMQAEYKNPYVFIYDRDINTADELIKILKVFNGQPLLIICSGLENEAFATLRTNRVRQQYPAVAIQAPFIGERRKQVLEDIAILTGATVVSEASGFTLDKLTPKHFGKCDSITVTQHHTTIVGGQGKKEKVQERIDSIKHMLEDNDTKGYDKAQLRERSAALQNGIAVMYVGGVSQVEINEKKDRCDDAVRATKAALEEGVVPGGGYALLRCGVGSHYNKHIDAGRQLIEKVLSAPMKQICANAGKDGRFIANKCIELGLGFNVVAEDYENLMETGIVDPLKVVRVTLEQAASVAGTMLTSSGLIVELAPVK